MTGDGEGVNIVDRVDEILKSLQADDGHRAGAGCSVALRSYIAEIDSFRPTEGTPSRDFVAMRAAYARAVIRSRLLLGSDGEPDPSVVEAEGDAAVADARQALRLTRQLLFAGWGSAKVIEDHASSCVARLLLIAERHTALTENELTNLIATADDALQVVPVAPRDAVTIPSYLTSLHARLATTQAPWPPSPARRRFHAGMARVWAERTIEAATSVQAPSPVQLNALRTALANSAGAVAVIAYGAEPAGATESIVHLGERWRQMKALEAQHGSTIDVGPMLDLTEQQLMSLLCRLVGADHRPSGGQQMWGNVPRARRVIHALPAVLWDPASSSDSVLGRLRPDGRTASDTTVTALNTLCDRIETLALKLMLEWHAVTFPKGGEDEIAFLLAMEPTPSDVHIALAVHHDVHPQSAGDVRTAMALARNIRRSGSGSPQPRFAAVARFLSSDEDPTEPWLAALRCVVRELIDPEAQDRPARFTAAAAVIDNAIVRAWERPHNAMEGVALVIDHALAGEVPPTVRAQILVSKLQAAARLAQSADKRGTLVAEASQAILQEHHAHEERVFSLFDLTNAARFAATSELIGRTGDDPGAYGPTPNTDASLTLLDELLSQADGTSRAHIEAAISDIANIRNGVLDMASGDHEAVSTSSRLHQNPITRHLAQGEGTPASPLDLAREVSQQLDVLDRRGTTSASNCAPLAFAAGHTQDGAPWLDPSLRLRLARSIEASLDPADPESASLAVKVGAATMDLTRDLHVGREAFDIQDRIAVRHLSRLVAESRVDADVVTYLILRASDILNVGGVSEGSLKHRLQVAFQAHLFARELRDDDLISRSAYTVAEIARHLSLLDLSHAWYEIYDDACTSGGLTEDRWTGLREAIEFDRNRLELMIKFVRRGEPPTPGDEA